MENVLNTRSVGKENVRSSSRGKVTADFAEKVHGPNGSKPVNAYYDPKSGTYWIPAVRGSWTRVKTIAPYLIHRCNISDKQTSEVTLLVQEYHSLVYVGPLAGRMPGIVETKEGLALVTKGFTLIEPRKGDWSFIQRMLIERMGEEQMRHFNLYLKLGYEDLRDGKLTPGLFLAIAGPVNMHKTCVQELIITPIFGGRPGEPHQFFTNGTEFNGDFIGAEHLIITDIEVKGENRNTHFTSKVKQYCGTSSHRIHPKGRDAFQALAFWRISQSCNDDYPHILALPDLGDPTVADKILLLHVEGHHSAIGCRQIGMQSKPRLMRLCRGIFITWSTCQCKGSCLKAALVKCHIRIQKR